MKVRTVLATAFGVAVGYVLGTRAGRGKFEELKAQAQRIVTDPDVRQKVADLPNQVRENLPKAQSAVSDAVKAASEKVQGATEKVQATAGRDSGSPSGGTTSGGTTPGAATTGAATTATDPVDPVTPADLVDPVPPADPLDPTPRD